MRSRACFYFAVWLALVGVLSAFVVLEPEKMRPALVTYAVATWLAAGAVGIYEGNQIVKYLRRNHTAYLAELSVRRADTPFPVAEYSLAGAPEFLHSTDDRGDPLLPRYRQRMQRLRWLMPLAFVHSILVILLMVLLA